MAKVTLEKTHTLLEKLAEHVMNELPTRREMNEKLDQKTDKVDVENIKQKVGDVKKDVKILRYDVEGLKVDVKDIKQDVNGLKQNQQLILNGMDGMVKQLDIIRTEQVAFNSAFDRIEKRVAVLEEKETGYRIRDKRE